MSDSIERGGADGADLPEAVPPAREGGRGMAIYAAAAGLATAVPVPFLDAMLAGLARGAAMRRTAARRGVRMSPAARKLLARSGWTPATGSLPVRVARGVVSRAFAPVRMTARAEDALATLAAAILLDHHLASPNRAPGAPLDEPEARRIRAAIDEAIAKGAVDSLLAAPRGFWQTLSRAVRAVGQDDVEGRNVIERAVDALLDGVADAPGDVTARLCARFDALLARNADGDA